jgi:hypothetical protein
MLTAIETTTRTLGMQYMLSHATSAKIHLIVRWLILSEKYYANTERNLGRYVITYSVTYITCMFTWLAVGFWKGVGLRKTFIYDGGPAYARRANRLHILRHVLHS